MSELEEPALSASDHRQQITTLRGLIRHGYALGLSFNEIQDALAESGLRVSLAKIADACLGSSVDVVPFPAADAEEPATLQPVDDARPEDRYQRVCPTHGVKLNDLLQCEHGHTCKEHAVLDTATNQIVHESKRDRVYPKVSKRRRASIPDPLIQQPSFKDPAEVEDDPLQRSSS